MAMGVKTVDEQERERGRAEMEQLMAALKQGSAVPAARRKALPARELQSRRRKQRVLLGVALGVLVLGFASTAFKIAAPPSEEALAEAAAAAAPPLSPQETESIHAVSRVLESKFPRAEKARWVDQRRDYVLERQRLLKNLEVDGQSLRFFPVTDVKLRDDGQPLACYCLLHMPLDPMTEGNWARAGLLRQETDIVSPFLRYVVLDNAEALQYLEHGCVDRVTYSLSPPPEQ